MFYKFDEEDNSRLNRGVRGRLMDKVKYLMKEEKIDGYDVNFIYENTKKLKPENE
jgi:NAD-dependent DNA ligase